MRCTDAPIGKWNSIEHHHDLDAGQNDREGGIKDISRHATSALRFGQEQVCNVSGGSSRPCRCPEHRRDCKRRLLRNGDSAPNWLPGGVGDGEGGSEAVEAFVTTFADWSKRRAKPKYVPAHACRVHHQKSFRLS
jgi:hypothetical protein